MANIMMDVDAGQSELGSTAVAALADQKITKVEAFPISVKYAIPVASAYGVRHYMDGVLVKLTTDAGLSGYGEAGAAIPGYLGETQESIMAAITKVFAPTALIGADPLTIDGIVRKMDKALLGNTQAKSIVDIALHDLVGKILGIPTYKLIGGGGVQRNPIAWVLTADDPKVLAEGAAKAAKENFGHIDVKVAALTPAEDMKRIAAVREAIGPDTMLTVDANGAWTTEMAVYTLNKMRDKFDLHGVEQPVADIIGMAEVRKRTGLTVVADEAVRNLADLRTVIELHAADVCGAKLARVGGIHKTRQMITISEAAGMPFSILSSVGTGLLCSAEATMLSSSHWMSRWPYGHKSSNGLMFIKGELNTADMDRSEDFIQGGVEIENAHVTTPSGPGLGIEVDEDRMMQSLSKGFEPVTVTG